MNKINDGQNIRTKKGYNHTLAQTWSHPNPIPVTF